MALMKSLASIRKEIENLPSCSKSKRFKRMDRVTIKASQIEFYVGSNVIWVHSPLGATILRIKVAPGKQIKVSDCKDNPVSHSDIIVADDIEVCLSKKDGY